MLTLLGLWCGGLTLLTLFEVDPPGAPRSLSGDVHNVSALVAFVGLHPEMAIGLFERTLFGIDVALLLTMVRPLLISAPR